MVILGIDPGSRKTGFGLLEYCPLTNKIKLLKSGVLNLYRLETFEERLCQARKNIHLLISSFAPDILCCEKLIYRKNIHSLIQLAHVRGAMLSLLSEKINPEKKILLKEYAPNTVKKWVTGQGHASKEQVLQGIIAHLGPLSVQTDDESDALAVGLCYVLESFCVLGNFRKDLYVDPLY